MCRKIRPKHQPREVPSTTRSYIKNTLKWKKITDDKEHPTKQENLHWVGVTDDGIPNISGRRWVKYIQTTQLHIIDQNENLRGVGGGGIKIDMGCTPNLFMYIMEHK